jgi:hypothetical protein
VFSFPNFSQPAPFVQPSDQMQIISKSLIASFFRRFHQISRPISCSQFFPPTLKEKHFERKVCHR